MILQWTSMIIRLPCDLFPSFSHVLLLKTLDFCLSCSCPVRKTSMKLASSISMLSMVWNVAPAKRSNQSILKEISPEIHWKDWCWNWNSNTLATWCEELTHLKRPWCWERLKAGGEGDDRGRDGWMASPTQWTWVWVNSRSWWWTGRPAKVHGVTKSRTQLSNGTALKWFT